MHKLNFCFRIQVSCKVAFEERICNTIVNKFVSSHCILSLISISGTSDGAESSDRILVNQNLFTQETMWVSYLVHINSSLKAREEFTSSFIKHWCDQWNRLIETRIIS